MELGRERIKNAASKHTKEGGGLTTRSVGNRSDGALLASPGHSSAGHMFNSQYYRTLGKVLKEQTSGHRSVGTEWCGGERKLKSAKPKGKLLIDCPHFNRCPHPAGTALLEFSQVPPLGVARAMTRGYVCITCHKYTGIRSY